jgi:hypothetical protein
MSFVRSYLRERDTVTNLEFDVKDETDEEELLQAQVNMMVQRNKRSRILQVLKISSKIRFFEGHALDINLRRHPQS